MPSDELKERKKRTTMRLPTYFFHPPAIMMAWLVLAEEQEEQSPISEPPSALPVGWIMQLPVVGTVGTTTRRKFIHSSIH
jgi:hypothetical protein